MQNRNSDIIKNYIFDLYGTLIDIKTDEMKDSLWQSIAGDFSGKELRARFLTLEKQAREEKLKLQQTKFNDKNIRINEIEIKLEYVFEQLFKERNVSVDMKSIMQLMAEFRSLSTEYIRLFDGVAELLKKLRDNDKKIYLLSNAQRAFTEPEMKMLNIYDAFDGILYSSDADFQKPSRYFYDILFKKYNLRKEESAMVGNEFQADVLGADSYGIRSFYISGTEPKEKPKSLPDGCTKLNKISDLTGLIQ